MEDTMIDWESGDWGGRVHLASNGSWVPDRHGDEADDELRAVDRAAAARSSTEPLLREDR
jgi:hypothetical protein